METALLTSANAPAVNTLSRFAFFSFLNSFPGPVHHGRARPEQVERAGQLAVGGGDAAVARAALGRHRRPLHLEPLPERRVGSGVGAGD